MSVRINITYQTVNDERIASDIQMYLKKKYRLYPIESFFGPDDSDDPDEPITYYDTWEIMGSKTREND